MEAAFEESRVVLLPHPPSPILELRVTKSVRTGVYSSQDIIVGFTFSGSLFCMGCLGFSCFFVVVVFFFFLREISCDHPSPVPTSQGAGLFNLAVQVINEYMYLRFD